MFLSNLSFTKSAEVFLMSRILQFKFDWSQVTLIPCRLAPQPVLTQHHPAHPQVQSKHFCLNHILTLKTDHFQVENLTPVSTHFKSDPASQ